MNYTLIKYETKSKCKMSRYGMQVLYGIPDKPGKKIEDFRKLLNRQKIAFKEKPLKNKVLFTW